MPFLPLLTLIGSIIFVNAMLSGDNVLVIGALLATLAPDRRWLVLALGGSGAIALRITCTLFVASWFAAPLMQAIGGLLLLLMAIQLLNNSEQNVVQPQQKVAILSTTEHEGSVKRPGALQCLMQLPNRLMRSKFSFAQKGLVGGIAAIVIADSTTSVDNILAIGALGATPGANALALAFGLALSMTLVFLVSTRLALLIHRMRWLTFAASLLLALRAGGLINTAANDVFRMISLPSGHFFPLQWFIYPVCCFVVMVFASRYVLPKSDRRETFRQSK